MLTLFSISLIVALALLCLSCRLLLDNRTLQIDLKTEARDNRDLRCEKSCLAKEVIRFETRTKSLEAKISSMTRRTRDARGRFVPAGQAAEVERAVAKFDEMLANGLVCRGVSVSFGSKNLKS